MKKYSRMIGRAILVMIPAMAILTYMMVKTTEKPEFCTTCHNMKPYYRAWKTSSHKEVLCIECHYPPSVAGTIEGKFKALSQIAKYVTGTAGTRPWAEISDSSCLRSECHERRLLEGKIKYKKVNFDHAPHLLQLKRGKKLMCTSCHSQMVMGDHIAVTSSTCFTCHFKDMPPGEAIGGCTACHEVPKGIIKVKGVDFNHKAYVGRGVKCSKCHIKVTEGNGRVPRERCLSCHGEPEHLKKYNDTEFMHRNHVTEHKVECYECHLEIKHGNIEVLDNIMPACETCHKDTHAAQRDLYLGVGGQGVPNRPSAMQIGSVACSSCHIASVKNGPMELEGRTLKAVPMACMNCHGVQFRGILENWQTHLNENIASIDADRILADKALQSWNADKTSRIKADDLFEKASFNLALVKMGKGAHNIPYAVELLRYSKTAFDALKSPESQKIGAILNKYKQQSDGTNTCTSACHLVPPSVVLKPFGRDFPHARHNNIKGVYCTVCHNNADKHGLLYINNQDCNDCHHGNQTGKKCADCHTAKFSETLIYKNKRFVHAPHLRNKNLQCATCHSFNATAGSYTFTKDCESCHHKAEGVACAKCHKKQSKEVSDSKMDQDCETCHEKGAAFKSPNNCDNCHGDKELSTHNKQGCKGCHVKHSWKIVIPKTCKKCHPKQNQDHIDGEFTDCAACHKPHE